MVLKDILDDEKYQNFLNLHVAIRILLQPKFSEKQVMFAGECLKHFVQNFGRLYGEHRLVYNMHSLIHLYQEVLHRKTSLESYSCFPFKNYLGQLKRLIRGTKKELQQVVRRLHERNSSKNLNLKRVEKACETFENQCTIKPNTNNDSVCVLTPTNAVIKVIQITETESVGHEYNLVESQDTPNSFENLFETPVKSSQLKYYIADGVNFDVLKNGPKLIFLSV